VLDIEDVAAKLAERLIAEYPKLLEERYKVAVETSDGLEFLRLIAKKRGFLVGGGEVDLLRTSNVLLDEFRSGKIGKITLERSDHI